MWNRQGGPKAAGERLFTAVKDHMVWYQVRVLRLEHVFSLFMFSSMIWKDPNGFFFKS